MIDHERLKELEQDFGADELGQVVGAFLEEAETAVDALRAGWSDDAVRRDRLHFLKGCARTVGAVRLGDFCERMEAGDSGPEALRELTREFDGVRRALQRELLRKAG